MHTKTTQFNAPNIVRNKNNFYLFYLNERYIIRFIRHTLNEIKL